MASRGMGAISPSKMPRGKKIERKDDPDTVDMYKRGGKVKKYNGEEESLVKKSQKDLSGSGEGFKPSAEELATGKFKQRAVDVGQMQEGAKFFPGFAQLSKDSQTVGGRGSYTKKLDKDTALEAYADMYLHKDSDGVKGGAPSYGARITHSFAKGGGVNAAGNYTKPDLRKKIVSQVKSAATQGTGAGQWSARKAQLVAKKYKAAGGGYRD